MQLFKLLTPEEAAIVKETNVRNCNIFDLTIREVNELLEAGTIKGLNITPGLSVTCAFLEELFRRDKIEFMKQLPEHSIFHGEATLPDRIDEPDYPIDQITRI